MGINVTLIQLSYQLDTSYVLTTKMNSFQNSRLYTINHEPLTKSSSFDIFIINATAGTEGGRNDSL